MGNTAAKRRTTSVTEELVDEDDEPQAWDEAPLFAELDRKSKHIDAVSVRRTEPASGYLGTMPPDVSEASLFTKWGGGSYILEGKGADTRIVPNARRQLKIAGDPVFKGEVEEMEYRRANGLPPRLAVAAPAAEAISTRDLMVMLEEKEERRRAEQIAREDRARAEQVEREDRERRLRDERDAQAQKAQDDRKAQAQKETDEREDRRARAQREDDERRSRIHREDMERLQAQNAAQLAQSQQFFQQLATTMAAKEHAPAADGGAVKALLTGLQVARDFMGGPKGDSDGPAEKPPDMLTSLIQNLPETLREVRKTASGVYSELSGKGGGAAAPAGVKPGEDFLTITGPTASKAKKVIQALMAAGKDPELELSRMLSFAAGALTAPAPKPSSKPAPPAAPVVDSRNAASAPPRRARPHRRQAAPPAARAAKVAPVARRPAARVAARRRRKVAGA